MWSASGPRNPNGPVQRNQSTPVSSQPTGHDDLFNPAPSSRMPLNQGLSPFGTHMHATSHAQMSGIATPRKAAISEMGPYTVANKSSSTGFGSQSTGPTHVQAHRGNGLLNALSANSRANEARSPPGAGSSGSLILSHDILAACLLGLDSSRAQDVKRPEDPRQKGLFREDGFTKTTSGNGGTIQATGGRSYLGAIGNDGTMSKSKDDKPNQRAEPVDPLAGMAAVDKWGIKGLRTLMNNYPDFHAMVVGMDPNTLGLDLSSQE